TPPWPPSPWKNGLPASSRRSIWTHNPITSGLEAPFQEVAASRKIGTNLGGGSSIMLTFLFWNLKSQSAEVLSKLVGQHRVDVLMLTECPMRPATILTALNPSAAEFIHVQCDCAKVQLYTRFSDEYVLPVLKEGKVIRGDDFSIR